jgi:hypothetical protein
MSRIVAVILAAVLAATGATSLSVVCPLGHQVHERCQFTAGSLFCVKPDCGNLRHRPLPWIHR